jgi:hypothetical protein
VALVEGGAGHADAGIDSGADALGADVAGRAGVPVVADRAIRLVGVRAARRVVASADDVALVERGAGHAEAVIDAGADAIGADVAGRVGVSVVAGRAVRLDRVRAARGVVASADDVALVESGAGHVDAVIDAGADAIGADITDRVGVSVVA